MDSGASKHVTGNKELLFNYRPSNERHIRLGDDSILPVSGTGDTRIGTMLLRNVLYVPQFEVNLLSVANLLQDGDNRHVLFNKTGGKIIDSNKLVGTFFCP